MAWHFYAPKFKHDGQWCVWKVEDAGNATVFRSGLTPVDAAELASWCRDNCPDEEVAAGINYLPGNKRGPIRVRTGV